LVVAGAVMAVPFGIALVQDLGGAPADDVPALGPEAELAAAHAERERARLELEEAERELAERELADQERARVAAEEAVAPELERDDWGSPTVQAFVDQVFLAGGAREPALVGPLAGARFGATEEELSRAAPALMTWARGGLWAPRARVELLFDQAGRLGMIAIEFPDDGTALAALTRAWGEPREELGTTGWRDASRRLVLALEPLEGGRALAILRPAPR